MKEVLHFIIYTPQKLNLQNTAYQVKGQDSQQRQTQNNL